MEVKTEKKFLFGILLTEMIYCEIFETLFQIVLLFYCLFMTIDNK